MTTLATARSGGLETDPRSLPVSRKFLIFAVMACGQFMALLDIQIVAASLNDVQAGLSAGPDEISWVQTSYLMAELVMIPFSAFLAQAISTRWLFSLSAALFTLSSIFCGLSGSIDSMIFWRAVQGFVGGAMIPTTFAVGFSLFEGKQRAAIPAILGMIAVLAPTIGPTVGGAITNWLDWRWIFFINIAPGIAVTIAVLAIVRVDRPDPAMLRRIDWVHLAAMAVALAGLQYVLEEGPKDDWFADPGIEVVAWVAFIAFLLFIERSIFSPNPVVRLSPFRKPVFAFACVFSVVIGFGIFASTYLVPLYLGRVRGFDSLQIGTTVFVVGAGQFVSTILAARLSQRFSPAQMIPVGLVGFAYSLWLTSRIGPDWGFDEFLVPQLVRGLFIMLCIVPSVNMALSEFEGAELRAASGLFNLMRNLGGAIGIATVNTWLQDGLRLQMLRFGEALGRNGAAADARLHELAVRFAGVTPDPHEALQRGQAVVGRLVAHEALALSFADVFRLMAWMFLAALLLVPFCRSAPGMGKGSSDAQ